MKLPPIAATLLKALLILLIVPALVGIYWLWLIWRYDMPYHRIAGSDTEARVIALLGRPYEISAPHDALKETWTDQESFGIAQREIVKRYRYRVPVITGAGHPATRPVDLALCGHGHNNVEYRIQWDPAGNEMRFFHDFYIENPRSYYGSRKAAVNFGQQRVMVAVKEGAPPNGTPTISPRIPGGRRRMATGCPALSQAARDGNGHPRVVGAAPALDLADGRRRADGGPEQ